MWGWPIGTGTDVAVESADVVLMSGNLQGVPNAIALSKATIRQYPPEPVLGLCIQYGVDSCRGGRAISGLGHFVVTGLRCGGDGDVERICAG
ncbi:Heavy metal translocating P-type ATPase [Salmonella bongori]|nr:Heavy metal translocating P-type ATPase [Salmonella bongori]